MGGETDISGGRKQS